MEVGRVQDSDSIWPFDFSDAKTLDLPTTFIFKDQNGNIDGF
jgi:hypothetical protein